MMANDRVVGGKYRIKRLLGTGSMAEVFEAAHVSIGKRVAIKVMAGMWGSSPELVARFRREARVAGCLDSEYILQVFDAGNDDDLGPYLVTELLEGEDLETRLAREGALDPPTAAMIGYQVARGLAKAHAVGIVHRDLKPSNVFLADRDDGAWSCKILDFGISKATIAPPVERRSEDDDVCLTEVGTTLGTPEYMSPEQARGLPGIDGRSDLWSLAVTLYEALAGRPAYVARRSFMDVLIAITCAPPAPLAEVAPWVPRPLCEAISCALVVDRDRRIPDAASFARAIAEAIPDVHLSASGSHPRFAAAAPVAAPEIEIVGAATFVPPEEDDEPPPDTRRSCPIALRDGDSDEADSERVEVFRRIGSKLSLVATREE